MIDVNLLTVFGIKYSRSYVLLSCAYVQVLEITF